MKRRELLVAGAVVAIAGCSSDQTDDEPSEDDEEPLSEDGGNESGTDPDAEDESEEDGNETDGEPEEPEEDEKEEEPTPEELSQEHIDAAQAALSSAIEDVESQGRTNQSFGASLDASVEGLSTTSIEDDLATVRSEVDEATEEGPTDEQQTTISGLEQAEAVVRHSVAVQPPLYSAYRNVEYIVEETENENYGAMADEARALERDIDALSTDVDRLRSARDAVDADAIASVDALEADQLEAQASLLIGDHSALGEFADVPGPLATGEEGFDPAFEHYENEEYNDAESEFLAIRDEYGAAASSAEAIDARILEDESERFECYSSAMEDASKSYAWAAQEHRVNGNDGYDYENRAEDALEEAADCGLIARE